VGKALTGLSFSAIGGWITDSDVPSEGQLNNFLSDDSGSATAGCVLGGSVVTSADQSAIEAGIVSPQVGASVTKSKQVFSSGIKW